MKIQGIIAAAFVLTSISALDQAIPPLLEYLRSESSDIFITGFTHSQVKILAAVLPRPISVISSIGLKENNLAVQRVLLEVSDEISTSEKYLDYFHLRYLIMPESNQMRIKEVNVTVPTFIFKPIHNGQVQIFLACPSFLTLNYVNLWSPTRDLAIKMTAKDHQSLGQRRKLIRPCPNELFNREIKVSAAGLPPYVFSTTSNSHQGIDVLVLDVVAERLYFNYTMTHEPNWGEVNMKTGIWTAMLGKVQSRQVTFGLGDVSLSWLRYQAIDYMPYMYDMDMYLLMRKPRPLVSYVNFLRPFDYATWLAIITTLILATMTLVLLIKISVKRPQEDMNYGKVWITCYYSQLQSALRFRWTQTSVGILFGFYFIHVFFINTSYLCNFRVYMMQTSYEPPIDSDTDLVQRKQNVLMVKGTVYPPLFQYSLIERHRDIFKNTEEKNLYFKYVKGDVPREIEESMIQTGDASIATRNAGILSYALSERRFGYVPFRMSKNPVFNLFGSIIVPKNKVWKSEVDDIIYGLLQGGIIDHFIDGFLPGKYVREEPKDTTPKPFRIEHVLGCLLLLSMGLAIGLIAFIFEVYPRR